MTDKLTRQQRKIRYHKRRKDPFATRAETREMAMEVLMAEAKRFGITFEPDAIHFAIPTPGAVVAYVTEWEIIR